MQPNTPIDKQIAANALLQASTLIVQLVRDLGGLGVTSGLNWSNDTLDAIEARLREARKALN